MAPSLEGSIFEIAHLPGVAPSPSPSATSSSVAVLSIAANTFSDTTVGNTHAAVTFTATNSGGSTATLSLAPALTTGTRFAITGGTCTNGGTIAAGATCTMTVTFTPAAGATYNDTLTLTYDDSVTPGQTATRAISGTGLTVASLAIAANTFSDTTVGNTHAAVTFTATNSGGSTATLSLAPALTTGTRFAITGGTCANGGTIAAGATCTMTVTFTPAAAATYNDTLTLTYNNGAAAGQTATRAITGNGLTVASLAIAANTFSDTTVGTTHAAVTFTATNSGGSTATLSLAPALTTGTRFAITGGTCANGGTIAAGATCTMTVTFTPAAAATYNDTLTLTYNNGAAAGQTATRAITGNGLTVASLAIAANTFSDTTVGNTHAAVTFTATNSGGSTATLSLAPALTTGTRFAITGGTCANGGTIAAGATCTMTVTFTPAAAATYNDTLTLTYNDGAAAGQTATRAITGNGLTVASLAIAANTFSDTTVGTTHAAVTFTATNSGGSTATLSLAPALTTGTRFAITGGTCANGGTIAAGATCTMTVTFTPAAAATYNDTLTLTYNNGAAAGQTATRTISGTGLSVASLAIGTGSFSTIYVGAVTSAVTFTVTNSGGSTATISSRTFTTGTNFSSLGGTCTVASTVAAGGTCTLTAVFSPTVGGTSNDTLNLGYSNGAAAGQSATRAIAGIGIVPITLSLGVFEIPAGATSGSGTVTLTNASGMNATGFTRAFVTGTKFSIASTTCGATLAAAASCDVVFTYSNGTPLTIAADLSYTATISDTLRLHYTTGAITADYDNTVDATIAPFHSGLGTSGSPFHLQTEGQLRVLRDYSGSNYYFVQDNHIDLQGFDGGGSPDPAKNWEAMTFYGQYDGQGFKIQNLYADYTIAGPGMFITDLNDGSVIQNLTIENVYINGTSRTGGLVGHLAGTSTLSYIQITGTAGKRTLLSDDILGGLVGYHESGLLTIDHSSVDLDIDSHRNATGVGGLVGFEEASIAISDSSTTGTLVGAGSTGGLIGRVTKDLSIARSSSSMAITETDGGEGFGGLVGFVEGGSGSPAPIDESTFSGSILLSDHATSVGGIIGRSTSTDLVITKCGSVADVTGAENTGGFIGYSVRISIDKSYSQGTITGLANYVGGFAGTLDGATVQHSYALGDVIGPDGGDGQGGFVGRAIDGTYEKSYSGIRNATSTPSVNLMNAFTGRQDGTGTYGGALYFKDQVVLADPNGAIIGLGDANRTNQSKYEDQGFDFGVGHDEWAMPITVPGSVPGGVLSPILRWQCTTTGYSC